MYYHNTYFQSEKKVNITGFRYESEWDILQETLKFTIDSEEDDVAVTEL